jgi:hypothetical protein
MNQRIALMISCEKDCSVLRLSTIGWIATWRMPAFFIAPIESTISSADQALDIRALKDVLSKNGYGPR